MLTFQDIILKLQKYWIKNNCLLVQPYDLEMGAATFHPFTTLKAIGNAPWPIGVTAVGIHDRTGRERIGSNKIAHIMDDEGTRKSLNAIKRILTYCQKVFPTDPSKMVFN